MVEKAITGGCACGQVRYSTVREPNFSIICQCRQCQYISGSGHLPQFAVPKEATSIGGEIKYFELTADSGNTVRSGFCNNCGSPLVKTTNKMPDLLFFHAGTMDDPENFAPQVLVHADSGQPWDKIDPALPRN